MTQPFANALDKLGPVEGGYSNNPADSGGSTNHGVTQALARQYGYSGHMKDFPKSEARRVYYEHFWRPLQLDDVARLAGEELAYEIFEQAVNMGRKRPVEWLQRVLNAMNQNEQAYADIAVDGIIGKATLGSLAAYVRRRGTAGVQVLNGAMNALQAGFYIELAERRQKDEVFLYGWLSQRV